MCDDVLVKVDRASMANSLETRAPFLDVNVVEYANSLPFSYKLNGIKTKHVLKTALRNILPREITHRPKKGFGIPIAGWFKEELKPLLLSTLNKKRIEQGGIFNWSSVDNLISSHLAGKRNNRKQLLCLLMFSLWQDNYLGA